MAVAPSASLRFPRARRIKQGRDFTRTKMAGRRSVRGCLIANWLVLPAGAPVRLGVITSRKLGNAVARSRARRLLRESFRLNQHALREPLDLVLVARLSIVGKTFREVETDYLTVLRQAGLLRTAEPSGSPA